MLFINSLCRCQLKFHLLFYAVSWYNNLLSTFADVKETEGSVWSSNSCNLSCLNVYCSHFYKYVDFMLLLCPDQLSLLPSAGWEMSSSFGAKGWRSSVAYWDVGISASCKPWVHVFADAGSGWLHSALRYIISSCQSAATSTIVKHFWSWVLAHVISAIASTGPLP